ncbi:Phage protein [Sodalis praecaptivus]|uniref:Phage protein n=2 Tax=Bruguierivoracaceae TaxID=2812006 RepID=W0I096_9GAMM|nr:DUF2513 domain-containing protein [Sodalis praecaptivus]AHF77900.1 Phage protein [Sodalis praecaptivus]
MKRDWDLVRSIMLKAENLSERSEVVTDEDFPEVSSELVNYHIKILGQAGLLEIIDVSTLASSAYYTTGLTFEGHDFLDNIRSNNVWSKTVALVKSKGIELTVDSIKTAATIIITNLLK